MALLEVEGLEVAELPAPHDPGQEEDEEEDDRCADYEIHGLGEDRQ